MVNGVLIVEMKIVIIIDCETVIYDMTSLIRQAIPERIGLSVLKVNQIIKFPMCHSLYMDTIGIFLKLINASPVMVLPDLR